MTKLPLNVWIIALVFSLTMTGVAMLVFIGGIIGAQLSPLKHLATLPIALFVVGNALFSIPAAFITQRFGRKLSAYFGFSLSLLAAVVFCTALELKNIYLFSAGGFLIGCGASFFQQFRFAAIESLKDTNDTGIALSVIMLSSIVGVFVGPELAGLGKNLLPGMAIYSGSFAIYAALILLAMAVFILFKNPVLKQDHEQGETRRGIDILAQQGFLTAVGSATVGFALMSFLMTSTPLSMHMVDGHSMQAAKGIIQSHLVVMYLPSLFSGYLIRAYGPEKIMLAGGLLYVIVVAIGMIGREVVHYWWALVLLGVGWNFLFLSGTTLLPRYYKHSERFKAQALNDFCVFSMQACASLSAGWVLFKFGWHTQLLICIVPSGLLVIAAAILIKTKSK